MYKDKGFVYDILELWRVYVHLFDYSMLHCKTSKCDRKPCPKRFSLRKNNKEQKWLTNNVTAMLMYYNHLKYTVLHYTQELLNGGFL